MQNMRSENIKKLNCIFQERNECDVNFQRNSQLIIQHIYFTEFSHWLKQLRNFSFDTL